MRINLYAQNRHVVVVDGVSLSGFAEGDFMQIKADGNAVSRTMGGDGPAMNLSAAQGGQITLGLNPTSPVYGTLVQLRQKQQRQPRLFSIQLITGVEEVISANDCGFGDLPQFASGGDKMQPRQFVFECAEINLDGSAVEAIGGGILGGLVG